METKIVFIIIYILSIISGLMRHFGPKTTKRKFLAEYYWRIIVSIIPVINVVQLFIGTLPILLDSLGALIFKGDNFYFRDWWEKNGENKEYDSICLFTDYPWVIEKITAFILIVLIGGILWVLSVIKRLTFDPTVWIIKIIVN